MRDVLPMKTPSPALALASVLLLASASGLAAQGDAGEERPGWIGVGIQESLDCGAREGEAEAPEALPLVRARDCRRVLVTEAVFEEGPAAEAGMQPGDTLIAVNGQPVSERRGARALGSLRPGRTVEILVGREGGRESVRITPEPRPRDRGPAPVLTPGRPDAPSIFVQPGSLARSDRPEGVRAPEVRFRFSDGEISGTLKVDEEGHVYLQKAPRQLVRLRGVELRPPEVQALRDSVLTEARQRLKEIRAELRARAAVAPALARAEDTERIRMLGAEFLALTPELAGNLRGVEEGLLVLRVVPGTPADHLGLRPGDVVVEAGGQAVAGATDLRDPFAGAVRGDSVVVRWVRRGEEMRGALLRR